MFTIRHQDEQCNNRSNDECSVGVKEEDSRQDEIVQEEKKERAKVVGICTVLILTFISLMHMTGYMKAIARALHTKEQALEYEVGFYESKCIVDAMVDVSWKDWKGKITPEQGKLYYDSYNEIVLGFKFNCEPSKELLEEYNESLKDIFGDEAKDYLLEAKEDRNFQGCNDGMTFWILKYNVEHAFEKGNISEKEYHKYEAYKNRVLDDISHEEIKKLIMYMSSLTNALYNEDETL